MSDPQTADDIDAAYAEGFRAHYSKQSRRLNPHGPGVLKHAWEAGWLRGEIDELEGTKDVTH